MIIANTLPAPPLPLQQQVIDNRVLLTVPWAMLLRWVLGEASAPTYLQGPHSDRVDPDQAKHNDPGLYRVGTWWYETDRNVYYQVRLVETPPDGDLEPVWAYALGTMYGTLAPDERPADLDILDAGFEFRGTDQARHFIWSQTDWIEVTAVYYGTHAGRPAAASMAQGVTYIETDRGNALYEIQGGAWKYVSGTMRDVLANKPTDLGADDTGFLFYGTDYAHTWRWTGAAWEYAPGDRIAGEIAWFTADPGTVGWALCNGSAVTRTTALAGTASFTTPNLIGSYAKGGSVYSGAVVGAGGSITGTTAAEASHTHTVDQGFQATGAQDTGGLEVNYAPGSIYLATRSGHTHSFDLPPVTSSAGSAHSHGTGSLAVSGVEPAHVDLLPYVRL